MRHGTLPRQIDPVARVIWLLEKLNLVHDVRLAIFGSRPAELRADRRLPSVACR